MSPPPQELGLNLPSASPSWFYLFQPLSSVKPDGGRSGFSLTASPSLLSLSLLPPQPPASLPPASLLSLLPACSSSCLQPSASSLPAPLPPASLLPPSCLPTILPSSWLRLLHFQQLPPPSPRFLDVGSADSVSILPTSLSTSGLETPAAHPCSHTCAPLPPLAFRPDPPTGLGAQCFMCVGPMAQAAQPVKRLRSHSVSLGRSAAREPPNCGAAVSVRVGLTEAGLSVDTLSPWGKVLCPQTRTVVMTGPGTAGPWRTDAPGPGWPPTEGITHSGCQQPGPGPGPGPGKAGALDANSKSLILSLDSAQG